MTDCRNCRRDTELFLCALCQRELHTTLDELPWLLVQLDITVGRQDKLNLGIAGGANPNPSPINLGAMELARNIRTTLSTIVRDLCENVGQAPPDRSWTTPWMAEWLSRHHTAIAATDSAGDTMREIHNTRDALIRAINRNLRCYVGPCTTVRGHDRRGRDIECGHDLYANRDNLDERIQCPRCKSWLYPREQLMETIHRRDLLPESHLLETLDSLGEPVSRVRFYAWLRDGRIKPRGYVHAGRIVPRQIQRGDARVFSLTAARRLRVADQPETVHP